MFLSVNYNNKFERKGTIFANKRVIKTIMIFQETLNRVLLHTENKLHFPSSILYTELKIAFGDIPKVLNELREDGYVEILSSGLYRVTGKGKTFIESGGYKSSREET